MTLAQLRSAVAKIDLAHRGPRIPIALSVILATGVGAATAMGPTAGVQVIAVAIGMLEAAIALRLQQLRLRETEATVRTAIARETLRARIYQAAADHVTDELAELTAQSALPLVLDLAASVAPRNADGDLDAGQRPEDIPSQHTPVCSSVSLARGAGAEHPSCLRNR